jgi:hypothetical protein
MLSQRTKLLCMAAALLAGICLCWNTAARGQDDPFGGEPAAKAKPAAAKAPAAQPRAAQAQGRATPAGPADLGPPEDPVVAALLASNPKTPSEIFHTAQLLLDASRPELAKRYLRKLLDAKLGDDQWVALVDEYHSSAFTDLAPRSELRPESDLVVQAALGAADRRLRDPARLSEEIKQLQDPSPELRARAIGKLKQAHSAAVDALIAAHGG